MSDEIRDKLLVLVNIKQKMRSLCDKYEKDLIMYVVDDSEVLQNIKTDDIEIQKQLSLMRTVEQKVYKRVIEDIEKILKIK
jgi:hypothetical protein